MNIVVNEEVHLSEFRRSDRDILVECLNDRDIYDRTLRVPFPYTEQHADEWLDLVAKINQQQGQAVQWAIRDADGRAIGGIGFNDFQLGKSHRAEIGYWLAKPFWGRGIMTAVVQRMCRRGFDEFSLVKILAHVFVHNLASARVLEKCGFRHEGHLRKHHKKDGMFIDANLYGLIAEDIER